MRLVAQKRNDEVLRCQPARISCAVTSVQNVRREEKLTSSLGQDQLFEILDKFVCRAVIKQSEPSLSAFIVECPLTLEFVLPYFCQIAI